MSGKKRQAPRVLEGETGLVHYEAPLGMDCVTLCHISDWLGTSQGVPTDEAVTCQPCGWIMKFCHSHTA